MERRSKRRCRIVAGVLALALFAGCAGSGDRAAVRSVSQQFLSAAESDDGETACAKLSPGTRAALEDQEKSGCRDAIGQLDLQSAAVESAQVYGRAAMVELADGDAVFLDQEQDGWRISAAGCTPVGDQPYDCELED